MPSTPHVASSPHLTRVLSGLVACLAAAYAFAWLVPLSASRAADLPTVSIVGKWRPTSLPTGASPNDATLNSHLYADPQSRLLYSYQLNPPWLAAYDLDTLKPRGTGVQVTGTKTVGFPDPVSGTLFVGVVTRPAGTNRIDQYGMRNGSLALLGSFDTTTGLGPGQEILGMYRAPDKPVLWLFSARAQGGSLTGMVDINISEVEIPGNDVARATRRWTKPITGCEIAMHGTETIPVGIGYVPARKALYFGCGNTSVLAKNPPVVRGVARLPLGPAGTGNASTPGDVEFFPVPGAFNTADAYFDPVSGRLLISTVTPTSGSSIIFFDTMSHAYVGSFAAGGNQLQEAVLEPVSGRFYALSAEAATGMVMTDVRATPARQGYGFPQFARVEGKSPVANFPVADPLTRRLIVKYDQLPDFVILQDSVPWYVAPEPDDPDRNTVNVPEEEGKTTALYSVAAQGYGSRHRQIGGVESLVINTVGIGNVPYPFGSGTRELRAAYLNGLAMSNGEAAASAITADRDRDNTEADFSKLPEGDPWPHQPAHCVDFGTEASDHKVGTTEVSCAAQTARVEAESLFEDSSAGGVTVDRSEFDAVGRRDAKKGAVSTVTATAKGINVLGGALELGEVTATAEAVAKGRPGTAKTNYTRTVRNVKLGGQLLCDKECNLQDLARQVNAQLVGKARIDFPTPDPVASAGSDGGYQALIRRSPFEQFQEQAMNGQPPDRIEVPAMVITVYQEDTKAGRTIVELAATQVEARYGIAVLGDDFDDFGGGDSGGDGFGDLGTALTSDSPIFGLDPTSPASLGRVPTSSARPFAGDLTSVDGLIWNGLKRTAQLLPIWAVLLLPIYLSARRWLLLQRDALVTGGMK